MKLVRRGSPSPLLFYFILSLFVFFKFEYCLVHALKSFKSNRNSRFDLTALNFYRLDVHDVEYLPPSFYGDILFILPLVNMSVFSAYGRSMDDMDKMCNKHHWCTIKTTNIQNNFGPSLRCSFRVGNLWCRKKYCNCMHHNRSIHNYIKWIGATSILFFVEDVVL